MEGAVHLFGAVYETPFRRYRDGPVPLQEPPESLLALLLASWAGPGARSVLHVARSETRADRLARTARSFAPELDVLLIPPWDCSPYDRASPSCSVMGRRVAALQRLAGPASPNGRLVVATVETVLQRLPPRSAWAGARLDLAANRSTDDLKVWLLGNGYVLDERVDEPGEAAFRGEVIEIFPSSGEEPVRIDLADGRIGGMRRYDPVGQRTTSKVDTLVLGPASEVLLPEDVVRSFLEEAVPDGASEILLGSPERPRRASGLEHRLPAFYGELETLFDYLPEAAVSFDPEIEERRHAALDQISDGHATRAAIHGNGNAGAGALFEPRHLYLEEAEWRERLTGRSAVLFDVANGGDESDTRLPEFVAAGDPAHELARFVESRAKAGVRIVLAAPDETGRARLARLVERRTGIVAATIERWAEVSGLPVGAVASATLDVSGGFALPDVVLIAAQDVGIRPVQARTTAAAADALLTAGELRPGDLVVHADHGIARLRGLELVEQGDESGPAAEFLSLDYAGGRKLLAPVLEIDRIWRYGAETADVALDRLGGEDWQARKAEVEAQLEVAARELLARARKRAEASGPPLQAPGAAYRRFVARFPFTETEDQARAITAALGDLARGAPPMDRLVCGDVGFGKTEVALRAACAAALAGRQVALVAPTTVLVRQHLETFRRRFAGLYVRIEQLSRLAGGAEARAVRSGIADGSVRIAIGTQALLSEQVRFADLGLVIIDEEQRFGARQKEQLRQLREGVHVLTLTATPIPRTLQSALVGLLDISVIATPPVRRRPVRTFLTPFDPAVVLEALRCEARRGGQSFVVCPRIQDLQPMADRLARLVPELDVAVAHGRMKTDALGEIMVRFAAGSHDVLLSTNIIESGLDIPNANTMLVWRADRFGLAQLHQLRGRVGRGARRAAIYLLTDPDKPLPGATDQRLRTLEALEGLGAGFAIGARDLDLRGAGDLLGEEQAGYVRMIGTELCQRLLGRALRRVRGEPDPIDCRVELQLGTPALIPDDYVPEPEIRIALYRRLLELTDAAEVAAFGEELIDRFGSIPAPAEALIGLAELRRRCCALGILRLEAGPKAVALEFQAGESLGRAAAGLAAEGADIRIGERRLIVPKGAWYPDVHLTSLAHLLERVGASISAEEHAHGRPDDSRFKPPG
jgi:transcription-repair coupling factor (superfamily II helicase)